MKQTWPANLLMMRTGPVRRLEQDNVLLEFNGPTAGIFTDDDNRTYLGVWCDEDKEHGVKRWVLAHARMQEIRDVILRRIPLRDVFEGKEVDVVDYTFEFEVSRIGRFRFDDLPEAVKPRPNALLPQPDPAVVSRYASYHIASRYESWFQLRLPGAMSAQLREPAGA